MTILVSACLLGENCKYDGGSNRTDWLIRLQKQHRLIPVCPEMLGGLPAPRMPAEISEGTVISKDGRSFDEAFRNGARKALRIAEESGIDCAILQSRSPSCGKGVIYDGTFSGKLVPGNGVFASLLENNGFTVIDVREAERMFGQSAD